MVLDVTQELRHPDYPLVPPGKPFESYAQATYRMLEMVAVGLVVGAARLPLPTPRRAALPRSRRVRPVRQPPAVSDVAKHRKALRWRTPFRAVWAAGPSDPHFNLIPEPDSERG
jgi:hypothetical protein